MQQGKVRLLKEKNPAHTPRNEQGHLIFIYLKIINTTYLFIT